MKKQPTGLVSRKKLNEEHKEENFESILVKRDIVDVDSSHRNSRNSVGGMVGTGNSYSVSLLYFPTLLIIPQTQKQPEYTLTITPTNHTPLSVSLARTVLALYTLCLNEKEIPFNIPLFGFAELLTGEKKFLGFKGAEKQADEYSVTRGIQVSEICELGSFCFRDDRFRSH